MRAIYCIQGHLTRNMKLEKKNPLKRDQALNDATNGQLGEEPRPEPISDLKGQNIRDQARKMSRDMRGS